MRRSRAGSMLVAAAATCIGLTVLVPGSVASAVRADTAVGQAGAGSLHSGGSVDEAWLTGAHPGDRITLLQLRHGRSSAGQPGHRGRARVADHPQPAPGQGYAWHDDTHRPADRHLLRPGPRRRPADQRRRCTPASPCTTGSTTSPCATASSWPPPSATPTGRPARRRPVPDGHRVLGLQRRRPDRPDPVPARQRPRRALHDCGDPNLLPDSATDVGAVVARVSGFATVSLQMRGTGCSGGAYDLFGYPSDYDAYDASRSWPTRTGWPTTRSAWSASATRVSRSSRRPAPTRRTWPPSPR